MLVSQKRDLAATSRFFTRALRHSIPPTEVTTAGDPRALDELAPAACHVMEKYANTRSKLTTADLSPGCGRCAASQLRCARVISTGHAFIQNICRGHYELGVEKPTRLRVAAAFTELALAS